MKIKTKCNKRSNSSPEEDQENGRKRLDWWSILSLLTWPWHKETIEYTWTSSQEEFKKETTESIQPNLLLIYIYIYIYI